jgi:hypothetical protein
MDPGWLIALTAAIGPVIAIASVALAITLYMRSRNPAIRGPALTGTAQVLSVQTTGAMINQRYVLKIALMVQVPGRGPYSVFVSRQIHPIQMAAIQPGRIVPVQVDAAIRKMFSSISIGRSRRRERDRPVRHRASHS